MINDEPLLTIIIPCYNVKKYIDRCLKDLLNSSYEIILIDDGSTDGTSIRCDYYNKYNNIKVYHKKNGGLSEARNFGLERASGKNILFLDSDDYINIETLKKVLYQFEKEDCEMIYCNFYKDINGKIIEQNLIKTIEYYSGIEGMKKLLLNNTYRPMVWKNLYKRDFLLKNQLYFKVGYLHEDEDWLPRVLFKAKKIIFYPESFYYYCLNEQSITQNKKDKNYTDLIQIVKDLRRDLQTTEDKNLRIIDSYFINLYLASYIRYDKEIMYLKYNEIKSATLKFKYILSKYFRKIYKRIYLKRINGIKKF